MRAVIALLLSFPILAACNNQDPNTPKKSGSGEVPANSLNEARIQPDAGGQDEVKDPTQPLTQKIGEPDPMAGTAAGASSSGPAAKPNPNAASKPECDKAMDKYISLEISSNPQLKGVPPEVIEQAKQMTREQHGEQPCTATKAQIKCAMAATTTAAWQKCMK